MTKKERIEALNEYIASTLNQMEYSRMWADKKEWSLSHKAEHVWSRTSQLKAQANGAIWFATIYEGLRMNEYEESDLHRLLENMFEECNDWTKEYVPCE